MTTAHWLLAITVCGTINSLLTWWAIHATRLKYEVEHQSRLLTEQNIVDRAAKRESRWKRR